MIIIISKGKMAKFFDQNKQLRDVANNKSFGMYFVTERFILFSLDKPDF